MPDIKEVLDLYDRVVAACVGVVPASSVEEAAEIGRAARRRIGYLGDTVVVALAGGTGSGKSSLVNALAGEEVSPPGARRPTTSHPVAWIPSHPEPGLVRLLDDLGIDRRVGHDDHPWLALIDLPDTDSVIVDHRHTVSRLLPLVDAVAWVVDPEKYKDARLHREQIAPTAAFADRFIFVLNQVDRLRDGGTADVVTDLIDSLREDGVADPTVVVTAGDPPDGLPLGLDELVAAVRGLGQASDVVSRRVIDELGAAADRLVAPLGGAAGTGFASGWNAARDSVARKIAAAVDADLEDEGERVAAADARAVTSLIGGRSPSTRVSADVARLPASIAAPLRVLVDEVGSAVDRGTRSQLVAIADRIGEEVRGAAATIGATSQADLPPPPSWWSLVRVLIYGLGTAALVGLVLAVDGIRSGGDVAPGAVTVGASVIAVAALRLGVARSARRRVETALTRRRSQTVGRAEAELERRLGRPLRATLRARSAPGAAYMELMLGIRRYEERRG